METLLAKIQSLDAFTQICLGVCEILGLCIAISLWVRGRKRILPRIFWTVILLVPFFGLLVYAVFGNNLDPNFPERWDTQSDSNATTHNDH